MIYVPLSGGVFRLMNHRQDIDADDMA